MMVGSGALLAGSRRDLPMHGAHCSTRRHLWAFLPAIVIAALPFLSAAPACAQNSPTLQMARAPAFLTVVSSGALPGFRSADVPSFLSAQMSDTPLEDWHFEPIAADFTPPADRVEWTFRVHADTPAPAEGKPAAISLGSPKQRFVARQLVIVEVRLFLGDAFQRVTYTQVDVRGGPDDEELAQCVRRTAQRLLGSRTTVR
jgi:hypothetical protein